MIDETPPTGNTPGPVPVEGMGLPTVVQASAIRATPPFSWADAPPDSGPTGYELQDELGRGGMGVVYRARQVALNRVVALKVIRSAAGASAAEVARFLAEAEAVAAIRHPNVVQVFECGTHAGQPYMALEYLPGGTLATLIRRSGALAPRAAAETVAAVAAGVQAAHDAGIVHRDLKPANILLAGMHHDPAEGAGSGNSRPAPALLPKVTDFGIARRSTSDLTATGAIVGTPAYMAPEQAQGRAKFVGPAADVYALGMILYECLTGTVPFKGPDAWAVLRRVCTEAPTRPRKLMPQVPRDLELICLKCLEKEPHHRYPTAADLETDLRRFLDGRPVTARPLDPVRRAWRAVQRNPVVTGAAVAVLLSSSVGTAVAWVKADEAERNATIAQQNAQTANEALAARDVEEAGKLAAIQARLEAETRERKAETAKADALADKARGYLLALYASNLESARRALAAGDIVTAEQSLAGCPAEVRGWEWKVVNRWLARKAGSLPPPASELETRAVCASADGRWLAVIGSEPAAPGGDAPFPFPAAGPLPPLGAPGLTFGPLPPQRVWVWDLKNGGPPRVLSGTFEPSSPTLAFDADGKRIAASSADGIRVWDLAAPDKPPVIYTAGPGKRYQAVRFTPAGLAAVTAPGLGGLPFPAAPGGKEVPHQLVFWPANGKPGAEPTKTDLEFRGMPLVAAIAPNGSAVILGGMSNFAFGGGSGAARVYAADGKPLGEQIEVEGIAVAVVFSADGKRAAIGGNEAMKRKTSVVTLNDLAGEGVAHSFSGASIQSLEYRPDGKLLVLTRPMVFIQETDLSALDQATGKLEHLAKFDFADGAAALPDGRVAVVGGKAGVRVFVPAEFYDRVLPHTTSAATLIRDGRIAQIDHGQQGVRLQSLDGSPATTFDPDPMGIGYSAILPVGDRFVLWPVARLGESSPVLLYDPATKAIVHRWTPSHSMHGAMAADSGGKRVALGGMPNPLSPGGEPTVTVYDADTGKLEHTFPLAESAYPQGLAFSPDGRFLACAQGQLMKPGGRVTLWDVTTGKVAWSADGLPAEAGGVVFAPDGTVAAVCGDRRVRCWRAADGQPVREFAMPAGAGSIKLGSLAFSPDGTRLVAGGGAIMVWDVASAQLVLTIPQAATWVAFTADGRRLVVAAASRDHLSGRVLVYDAGP